MPRRTCEDIERAIELMLKDEVPSDDPKFRREVERLLECRREEPIRDSYGITIIIPKQDNAGVPIRESVIQGWEKEIAEHLGGITVHPHTHGCYVSPTDKNLYCDDSLMITTTIPKSDMTDEMLLWLDDLKSRIAFDARQESVYVMTDEKGVKFVPGKWEKRAESITERVIWEEPRRKR